VYAGRLTFEIPVIWKELGDGLVLEMPDVVEPVLIIRCPYSLIY
jgi:hypothetical protein